MDHTNLITPQQFSHDVICGFSTSHYGILTNKVIELDAQMDEKIITNRRTFFNDMDISVDRVVGMQQRHTDLAVSVGEHDVKKGIYSNGDGIVSDALITNEVGVALMVKVADCVPVFMYDPKQRVIAAVHSGWRGTYAQIVPKTIEKMRDKYESSTQDMQVWIGPHISCKNYIMSIEDFARHPANAYFSDMDGVEKTDHNFCVDLGKVVKKQLEDEGVTSIELNDECTFDSSRLRSYRGGEVATNNIGVIMMR